MLYGLSENKIRKNENRFSILPTFLTSIVSIKQMHLNTINFE